jgi:sugar fermentation stimulation protein A
MLGLTDEGNSVWLARQDDRKAKLSWRWLLVRVGKSMVCVDTSIPNRLVKTALETGVLPQFSGYRELVSEMPFGAVSRADFCLRVHNDDMLRRCWIEVKAVTMARSGVAYFPDAVTARGLRHLAELSERARHGERAVQLFIIQRNDCHVMRPADWIDPAYATALRLAHTSGVEMHAISTKATKHAIELDRQIAVEL